MEFTNYEGPLVRCSECQAVVPTPGMADHAAWHLRLGHIDFLLTDEGRRRVEARRSGR